MQRPPFAFVKAAPSGAVANARGTAEALLRTSQCAEAQARFLWFVSKAGPPVRCEPTLQWEDSCGLQLGGPKRPRVEAALLLV